MIEADDDAELLGCHRNPYKVYGTGQLLAFGEGLTTHGYRNNLERPVESLEHLSNSKRYVNASDARQAYASVFFTEARHLVRADHIHVVLSSKMKANSVANGDLGETISINVLLEKLIEQTGRSSIAGRLRIMAEGTSFLEQIGEQIDRSDLQDMVLTIIQAVFGWVASKSYETLDFVLGYANAAELPTEAIVALLRASGRYQTNLPAWRKFFEEAYSELGDRKLNARQILSGL